MSRRLRSRIGVKTDGGRPVDGLVSRLSVRRVDTAHGHCSRHELTPGEHARAMNATQVLRRGVGIEGCLDAGGGQL